MSVERRGGGGYVISTSWDTSYATGPPSSTDTKDRSIHPNIDGSTGGFIGLIAGIAIFTVIGLFLGFLIYNRHRRRLMSKARNPFDPRGFGRPNIVVSPRDPYADPIPSPHEYGKPSYAKGRSEEWEIPEESQSPLGLTGIPRRWDSPSGLSVDLPEVPDDAAAPLRSRSPRLSPSPGLLEAELPRRKSPRSASSPLSESVEDRIEAEEMRRDKGKGKAREDQAANPFESEHDDDHDQEKLSPQAGVYRDL